MKQKIKDLTKGISCPERWWFRAGAYLQFIYFMFDPNWSDHRLALIGLVTIYTLRSPNFNVYDDGIELSWLFEKRFIEWGMIGKVRITPTQLLIGEKWFPIPIFAFVWRKNFQEVGRILEEKLEDKVSRWWFPIPS